MTWHSTELMNYPYNMLTAHCPDLSCLSGLGGKHVIFLNSCAAVRRLSTFSCPISGSCECIWLSHRHMQQCSSNDKTSLSCRKRPGRGLWSYFVQIGINGCSRVLRSRPGRLVQCHPAEFAAHRCLLYMRLNTFCGSVMPLWCKQHQASMMGLQKSVVIRLAESLPFSGLSRAASCRSARRQAGTRSGAARFPSSLR